MPFEIPRALSTSPPRATLGSAVALLFSVLACGDAPPAEVAPPPLEPSNLLLITVDTLRADHLSSYGYPRPTSPTLDALAAGGVRFDQPAVQWPKTGPSFASIFTSTYPSNNGIVRQVGLELPCRFLMLAEVLQRRGYSTHAVVANAAVGREFYFDQGFDTYVETWKLEPPADGSDPNGAAVVTRLASAVASEIDASRPYFLWVHYLDPHFPYSPPKPWKDRFVGDVHYDPSRKLRISPKPRQEMMALGYKRVLEGRDEHDFYIARYDEEIAYTDAQIGELLDHLRGAGLLEETTIAFTSDHGESLGEHNYHFDHGRFGFQSCLRVPLILHRPGVFAPRVDPQPVALIDLAPTFLELAGVELEDGRWMEGQSLLPRLRGAAVPEAELVYSEAGYETGRQWQRTVRDRRFKMIYARVKKVRQWIGGPDVPFTLYDLANDPGETINVAAEYPEDAERLERALRRYMTAEPFDVVRDDATCEAVEGVDEETTELLKTLGYL